MRNYFRIRFSLRALLAAMLILCIVLGLIGNALYRIRHERWIVSELAKHNGRCDFDYEFGMADGSYHNTNYPDRIHAPAWLRRIFGDEALGRVAAVCFPYSDDAGANLRLLAELPYLEALDLNSTDITDAHLVHIAKCRSLRYLRLFPSRFTDDGFKALAGLNKLEVLELHSPIHDDVVQSLTALQNLEWLRIDSNNLTDAVLFHISKLHKLQSLELNGSGFRGRGLSHLRKLTALRFLNLGGWNLEEGGADQLSQLKQVDRLLMSATSIPEADVNKLSNISQLKWLVLPANVSAASVSALKQALPDCHVYGGEQVHGRGPQFEPEFDR